MMSDRQLEPSPNAAKERHAWERMNWLWSAILLATFLIPLGNMLLNAEFSGAQKRTAVGLVALVFLWHAGAMVLLRRLPDFRERLYLSIPYMVGLALLWYGLVTITDTFYFAIGSLFSQLFWTVPVRWATLLAVLLAALALYDQTLGDGRPFDPWLALIYGLSTAVGIGLGLWLDAVIRQSVQRRDLITQLEAAQSELAAAERRAGTLAERQRLAHEIHDTLAQGFISIIMHLETAEQQLDAESGSLARSIHQAKETARYNLQEARRVVDDLRPEPLENNSLAAALVRTVQRWRDASGTVATMQTTGKPLPLHPDVEVTLLRATQEALANVRKHAQAQNVVVTLSYMDDMVLLDVQDDGVGLQHGAASPYGGGFGLTAMRSRVAELGGDVLLESEVDGGTTLVVQIPVSAA